MAVVDNLAKVAGTLLAIVKTRCELMAIELEEEWIRLLTYLLLSLTALFCLALTVLVLCWDTCRIPAIVGMMVLFGVITCAIWIGVRRSFSKKPKLLELTRQEIAKDIDRLTPSV